ncbi:hypothetical protein F4805DRAFT_472261 [Annulohypoxylon moriforme]|nr:hypothetical protein F4805DRAFT_472261 [Annulohypoxylon moriforme]
MTSNLYEDPVVVVGLSFRFPQDAVSEDSFWDIMCRRVSTMTEVPGDRYNINGHHVTGPARHGTTSARGGHFLKEDVSAFDAPFFSMSAAEAKAMDPQLRLLLETSYHAWESAGIPVETVQGSLTSVFVGNLGAEYTSLFSGDDEINSQYEATGTAAAMLSNRVSWFYDLRGPSITIDTACSSSLIALHLACQNLLKGESEMSLVCGAQLQFEPRSLSVQASRLNFISPDSHCYSFDDRANGYSRGEGVGVVVLKRLSKALEDDDTIRAVIRSTYSNQDGRTPSITQPSAVAQAALIREAYKPLNFDFRSTDYVEAHGTGTAVGDPIEAHGLSMVFSECRDNPLFIGSVKANIGHLEAAAGVAGLIKTVLALEKGVIPPIALLDQLNPKINAEAWNFKFPTSATPWPRQGLRRASVNSFGFGGANAHAVVDDALHYLESRGLHGKHNTSERPLISPMEVPIEPRVNGSALTNGSHQNENDPPVLLFVLTASDKGGIERYGTALGSHLKQLPNAKKEAETQYLHDLAFTLAKKRSMLPWKSFVLGRSLENLQENLSTLVSTPLRASERPILRFVFTGQGAQWPLMGKELLEFQVFRDSLQRADSYFRSLGSTWSLLDELYGHSAPSTAFNSPRLAQPLCTALQIALVDLLASWGIMPQSVVGHSSGEIAAAYCVGALTEESAWRVAYFRGAVTATLSENQGYAHNRDRGSMLAVALSESELAPYIATILKEDDGNSLTCACINSHKNTTVSGRELCIDRLASQLQSEGIFARKLNVPVAYHSAQMKQVADAYRDVLDGSLEAKPQSGNYVPQLFSSVTAKAASVEDLLHADYWVSNLVSRVRFSEALQLMCSSISSADGETQLDQKNYLLEVGPHCSLERPIKESLEERGDYIYDHTMRRDVSSIITTKTMVGNLFTNGYPVNIQAANIHRECEGRELRQLPKMLLDLPKYPFNHSTSYWLESRLSKNHRFRQRPRHELLGNPSRDWNALEPYWRFTIRVSDLPWVLDHKIQDTVLYPAAGMLVMVLEGIRSITADLTGIEGYRLRDVNIISALVVPTTDDGVEVQLHMRPIDNYQSMNMAQSWNFRIISVVGDEWRLHCSGEVHSEQSATSDTICERDDIRYSSKATKEKLSELRKRFVSGVDKSQFYEDFAKHGIRFGRRFHNLEDIFINADEREATGSVVFDEWTRLIERRQISEHLIHPLTLDSFLHVIYAAARKDWASLPTMIPTQFGDMYFSRNLLGGLSEDRLFMYSNITGRGTSSVHGSLIAMDNTTGEEMVVLKGCRLSGFGTANRTSDKLPSLFHQVVWKPDISFLSQGSIERYCREQTQDVMVQGGTERDTEVVSRYFMSAALDHINRSPIEPAKLYLAQYIEWMRTFIGRERESTSNLMKSWVGFDNDELRPGLLDEYASKSLDKSKMLLFGRNLIPILTGELDPLDLLFNQGILESFYQSPLFSLTSRRIAAYMDLLAHKNSDIRIIEVGAGTGSTTTFVLDALSQQGRYTGSSPRFSQYDFTDISPSFFAKAQERYARHSNCMRFKTLNLERDPLEQGFEANSYDVVIAASVLHATKCIDQTLKNVKKLLKPGGRLILAEPTNLQTATIPFFSGVISGWWLSAEKFRALGPLLSKEVWRDVLNKAGFDGFTMALSDATEETHGLSLMVSRAPPLEAHQDDAQSTIILVETAKQRDLANEIQAQLVPQIAGICSIEMVDSFSTTASHYDRCICLWELGRPIMDQLSDIQFMCLKRLLQVCKQILWVNDSCGIGADKPEASMVSGFLKTVIRERPSISFTYLNVELGPSMVTNILRVINQLYTVHKSKREIELVEQQGIIQIPRVIEAPHINKLLYSETQGPIPEPLSIGKEGEKSVEPMELRFSPGRLDSLYFGPDPSSTQRPLREDELEVSVRATGINFKDILVVLNRVIDDHIGQEFAGQVTRVGSAVTTFSPGDRVCGIAKGTFRSLVHAPGICTMKIPTSISYTEACAIPLAYATAQYGLCHIAQLKAGDSVLIHAAAGAVGQAAIQIAQHIGARVLVTVSSPEKKELLIHQYGINPSCIFSSRHIAFSQEILQKTGGQGVDVVLNSLSGRALTESWRCLAPLGRFIEIGKRDISSFNSLPMEPFQRNVSFCSVDLGLIYSHHPSVMERIMREVERLVLNEASRKYTPPYPITAYKRSGFEAAFRLLQTGQHSGKVVVDWEQPDVVQAIPQSKLNYRFVGDATYLIAGGLGGIGRSAASWLCETGAKHLVLLSRSGPKSEAAKELIVKLELDGVQVYAPQCDVSDEEALKRVVKYVEETMPPIRGCIQGSMVIENRVFQDYTRKAFQSGIDPKVRGTWNLHNVLPRSLDFFVLLSSLAGVHGASSQSSYAAANSFLDAFARYRRARGERCVALDLGIVENIGYIAERIDIARTLAMTYTDHKYLSESDLHFMLKWACCPPTPAELDNREPEPSWDPDSQLIGALTTPAFVARGGLIKDHGWMRLPIFCHLYQMEADDDGKANAGTAETQADSVASQLQSAGSVEKAAVIVTTFLARRLAKSLSVRVEDIDTNRPPHAFGVDSLVAVELLHWFSTEVKTDIPVVQILGSLSIKQLGMLAAETSEYLCKT